MAYNYNHVTLVGRLARDPEFYQISPTFCKCCFTIAVGRNYKKDEKQGTDFLPIVLFGKVAELGKNMLKKGMPVLVWGKIRVRTYKKENTEQVWVMEVNGDNFQILEKLEESKQRDYKVETMESSAASEINEEEVLLESAEDYKRD